MYHMVKLLYSGCGQVEQERCLPSSLSLFNQLVHVLCLSLSIAAAPLPRTWSGGRAPPRLNAPFPILNLLAVGL